VATLIGYYAPNLAKKGIGDKKTATPKGIAVSNALQNLTVLHNFKGFYNRLKIVGIERNNQLVVAGRPAVIRFAECGV